MLFKNFFKRHQTPPPSPSGYEPAVVSPWRAQNQETLDELARFIDFADGFTLGFLEINFEDDLDAVLKALRTHRECAGTQFHVFNFDDPNLRFLKDELEGEIQKLTPPISSLLDKKGVIFVKGLENAIGLFGDYPPVLQDLNFVRDAWIESVPHPVIFCLPSYAINRIIKFAPDFWSWKSGIFRFLSSQEREDEASIYALHAQKIITSASKLERKERINFLEMLAQEFDPLQTHRNKDDLRIAAKALIELCLVHMASGEYFKAQSALKNASQIFDKPEWKPETRRDLALRILYLTFLGHVCSQVGNFAKAEQILQMAIGLNDSIDSDLKGTTFFYLGRLKTKQGEVEKAIALFQKSLAIKQRLGNKHDEASNLNNLGYLKANQGATDDAIVLYQQALDIAECIGNAQGQAEILHNLGSLKANQGNMEAAMALFQKSLEIAKHIGNTRGQAATLHEIGRLKKKQSLSDKAINFYQQSLAITKCNGDAQAQAATLHELGRLKSNQGEIEQAIALYQQSLDINNRLGNLQDLSITLQCLGVLKERQGETEEAIALYQQSLDIKKRINDTQGKAIILSNLGSLKANQGDVEAAIQLFEESLGVTRKTGEVRNQANILDWLGQIAQQQGELDKALVYCEESLAIRERIKDPGADQVRKIVGNLRRRLQTPEST
jgi:tetratricopeptide (TPR) repeat protein